MVVGNGSIAKLFIDEFNSNSDIIIFASGVSDSNEKREEEFEREKKLLVSTISDYPNSKVIYFSSIFSNHVNNDYYSHKKNIEKFITENVLNYLIIRLPQVISQNGNVNNLVNFFVTSVKKNAQVEVQKNTKRALVDVEDVKTLTCELIKKHNKKILNFSCVEQIGVYEIYKIICEILDIKPNFKFVSPKFITPSIQNDMEINELISQRIDKENYTYKILKKYVK